MKILPSKINNVLQPSIIFPLATIAVFIVYVTFIFNVKLNNLDLNLSHPQSSSSCGPDCNNLAETQQYKNILSTSWDYYKKNFIVDNKTVVDPMFGHTNSEGQSYAMLRSVWIDDKSTFNNVWLWTKENMQIRKNDSLFAWQWKNNAVTDMSSASDGDIDIATALVLASDKWNDNSFAQDAEKIIKSIWLNEVIQVGEKYYLISAAEGMKKEGVIINPSYFSPASYKIFKRIDPLNNWDKLINDTYTALDELSGTDNLLPPNWSFVRSDNFKIADAKSVKKLTKLDSDTYSYDAFRTFWRVMLDDLWYKDARAKKYLLHYTRFFNDKLKVDFKIKAAYSLNGFSKVDYSDLSTDVGVLSVLYATDTRSANEFFKTNFINSLHEESYWGDSKNYYTANWAWFATALYAKKIIN